VTRWKTRGKKDQKNPAEISLEKNWGENGQFSFLKEHLKKAS
jgi:hypothetical protein